MDRAGPSNELRYRRIANSDAKSSTIERLEEFSMNKRKREAWRKHRKHIKKLKARRRAEQQGTN